MYNRTICGAVVGDSMWEAGRVRLLRGRCVAARQFHVCSADAASAHLEAAAANRRLRCCPLRHRVAGKVPRQCLHEERSVAA